MSNLIDQVAADLASSDEGVRLQAAERLLHSELAANPLAILLVQAVADPSERVREAVTALLEELGPPEASAQVKLAELLHSPEPDCAYWAATLLGRLQAAAAAAVDNLRCSLQHPVPQVAARAAWALGQIGPSADTALPDLQRCFSSQNARLARLAREAAEKIRPSGLAGN